MSHAATPELNAESVSIPAGSLWAKAPALALGAGAAAMAGGLATGAFHGEGATAYLVSYLYFFTIAAGALFFIVIQHATRAGWSVAVRRIAELLAMGLPMMALLFAPIWLSSHDVYHHWMSEEAANDPVLVAKAGYLNPGFWTARTVFYLAAMSGMAWFFFSNSAAQDKTGDHKHSYRMRSLSYPFLPVLALSMTFAAFDWSMSLDPHWFSTMFGVCFFAGSQVAFFGVTALLGHALKGSGVLKQLNTEHFHDLGKYLFGFTIFWAYVNFSQFMLIWYGNIPEETIWFRHRWEEYGWMSYSLFLAIGHFGFPFWFLMSRHIKRNKVTLIFGAAWLLMMHYLDLFWQVMPTIQHEGPHVTLGHILSFVGIGGLYFGVVGMLARKQALMPVRDPRLSESLSYENF